MMGPLRVAATVGLVAVGLATTGASSVNDDAKGIATPASHPAVTDVGRLLLGGGLGRDARQFNAAIGPLSCGSPCCGATFTLAVTSGRVLDAVVAGINGTTPGQAVKCTAQPPASNDAPFVNVDGAVEIAALNCTVRLDGPLPPDGWHQVAVAILPVPFTAATEVRVFSISPSVAEWEDFGSNRAIATFVRDLIETPTYLKKPLRVFVGCDTPADGDGTDSDGGTNVVNGSELGAPDPGSCGAACCLTLTTAGGMTSEDVAKLIETAATSVMGLRFTTPFEPIPDGDPGTLGADGTFSTVVGDDRIPTDLDLQWVVTSPSATAAGNVTVRFFSLCTFGGSSPTRECFADQGVNARLHSDVFAQFNASVDGAARLAVGHGCGVMPPSTISVSTSASTGANVAGAVVAVALLIVTTIWIRHASVNNVQASRFPARILYVIFMLMLVNTIGKSGWLPRRAPSEIRSFSLNWHPPMMAFAVLVAMTEGLWAAPSAQADPLSGRWRQLHIALQCVGAAMMIVGLCAAVFDRQARIEDGENVHHLVSAHSWVGVLVFSLTLGQAAAGGLGSLLGGPKKRFALQHHFFGYLTYLSGILAIVTGLSQFGLYLAIEDDGGCLDDSFESTSCFDTRMAIMTCVAWGVAVTSLKLKSPDDAPEQNPPSDAAAPQQGRA